MSIDTLLEAAKFLELHALQQQKAREDELKEKLLCEHKPPGVISTSTTRAQECGPASIRPAMPPASAPITAPLPAVTSHHSVPPAGAPLVLGEQGLAPPPGPEHHPTAAPGTTPKRPPHDLPHHFTPQSANTSVQPPPPHQRYAGSAPSECPAVLPQSGTLLPQTPVLNGSVSRSSPLEDSRLLDIRKRPGGAGTREVHNKLEKNRRAHLKECFDTLKKNIPNVDEKKTSNLSVLRSALRYIQTLKRKEKEYEHDMERLAREKIATQQRLAELKHDVSHWMDVVELDRVLRQSVQPDEDQASTSTASEGEDVLEEDFEDEMMALEQSPLPAAPQGPKPDLQRTVAPPVPSAVTSSSTQHIAAATPPQPLKPASSPAVATQTLSSSINALALAPVGPRPALHPTVIAHSSVSHPSVIQTLNHVLQTHSPSSTRGGPVRLTPAPQPIGHITVHPVARLPTLYSQPGIVGHITHTLNHAHPQVNGTAPNQPSSAPLVGKQATLGAQMVTHHTQLVGQTVLNPVTMVTMPSFPISTLKLV